jgi:surface polysaccharide O-acyltransferase-like enzyme
VSRIQSVDVLRVVAIISVIAIHTAPFATAGAPVGEQFDLATLLHLPTRFAVPFFFILSGYFWSQKCEREREIYIPTIAMLKRVAFLFIGWSAIYLLPTNIFDTFAYGPLGPVRQLYWNIDTVVTKPIDTLMQGSKVHLWFLMALMWSLCISAIILRYKQTWLLISLSILLYSIGLAGKAYSSSALGFYVDFNLRNGPFFSLIFFVTGYFLYKKKASPAWFPIGMLIAFSGFLLQIAELSVLKERWGGSLAQDYVVGTYFLGLGVAMMGLSNSRYLSFSGAAEIGPVVLGIYASHYISVDLLKPLDRQFAGNPIWSISYVAAVFSCSYALTRLMAKYHLTRKLVL